MKQYLFLIIDAGEVDPDTAIVAADPLCQQALECQAEDMAIEDTLYALERALTDGHLPSDTYLKQVPPIILFLCVHCPEDQLGADRPCCILYMQPSMIHLSRGTTAVRNITVNDLPDCTLRCSGCVMCVLMLPAIPVVDSFVVDSFK